MTSQNDPVRERLLKAAKDADWEQVICNYGPPCFHLEDSQFCLRAERWAGHRLSDFHRFVSLADLLKAALAGPSAPDRFNEGVKAAVEEWVRCIKDKVDHDAPTVLVRLRSMKKAEQPAPEPLREYWTKAGCAKHPDRHQLECVDCINMPRVHHIVEQPTAAPATATLGDNYRHRKITIEFDDCWIFRESDFYVEQDTAAHFDGRVQNLHVSVETTTIAKTAPQEEG